MFLKNTLTIELVYQLMIWSTLVGILIGLVAALIVIQTTSRSIQLQETAQSARSQQCKS